MSELGSELTALVPGLIVQVQVPGYNHRARASLLGARAPRYLALRDNGAAGASLEGLHLRPADTLIVRFFHDGVAYGFRSNVQLVLREPETIIFVDYPRQTESLTLREAPRMHCNVPVRVSSEDTHARGAMLDISAAGCRLALPETPAWEMEQSLVVEFALPDGPTSHRCEAVVRRREAADGRQVLGLSADWGEAYVALEAYLQYRPPR